MGVNSMFVCVLFCQIIISTTFGAKLPFAVSEPSSLPVSLNGVPSSPTVPPSDVMLECLRSNYFAANSPSPTVGEFSSPLVVTSSSSTGLPVPKVEALQSDTLLSTNIRPQNSISLSTPLHQNDFRYKPYIYPDNLQNAMKLASLSNAILPKVPNKNSVSLPCVNSLPLICLEALKRNINSLNGALIASPYLPTYNSSPENKMSYRGPPNPSYYSLPYPLRYNQLFLPDVLTPSVMRPPTASSINNHDINAFNTLYTGSGYTPTLTKTNWSPNRVPHTSARISENSNPFITTRVPKVPFSTSVASYPGAFDNLRPSTNDRMGNRLTVNKGETISRRINIDDNHIIITDFTSWNPYIPSFSSFELGLLPEPNIPDVKCLDFTPPIFNVEPSTLQMNMNENIDLPNFIIPDMQPTVDSLIDTIDCNFNTNVEYFLSGNNLNVDASKFPSAKPNSVSRRDSSVENIPDLPLSPLPLYSNNNDIFESPILRVDNKPKNILEVCSPPLMKYPPKIPLTSKIPATYINVSPSYSLAKTSSNAISSLNDVVSSLTRNIFSSFVSYLASLPIFNPPSNPYGVPLPKRTSTIPPSSVNLINTELPAPSLYTSTTLPLKTHSYYEVPLIPIENPVSNSPLLYADCSAVSCYDDIPTSSLTYSNDVTEPISDTITLPPLKVALIPPTSFVDYISLLQPCPSILPSPTLPYFADTSTPIVVQPQVVKIKSLDKKYKTVNKLLQLVFLAELFHKEDIDWDALDAVLAVLCAS